MPKKYFQKVPKTRRCMQSHVELCPRVVPGSAKKISRNAGNEHRNAKEYYKQYQNLITVDKAPKIAKEVTKKTEERAGECSSAQSTEQHLRHAEQ